MPTVNRTPPLTTRQKAARRRDRIAGVVLLVVAVAAIALTVFIWMSRRVAQ
jgi:hypothetical protein